MSKYSLEEFNKLEFSEAKEELYNCCGSNKWVNSLMASFPFESEESLFFKVRNAWYNECVVEDYLEAFDQHPKIGDKESIQEKDPATREWAEGEQAGVESASQLIVNMLAKDNEVYYNKNGFIFIVCATGKSASYMLHLLQSRLSNHREVEIDIAKNEQHKITLLRLQKMIELSSPEWTAVSQITSHVLDTSLGKPGNGMCIKLKQKVGNGFSTLALGLTGKDGRVADLLPAGVSVPPGHYQMQFDTEEYFEDNQIKGFYPKVTIHFTTFDETHYHVPLLINPFGYSTYRGS